MPRWGSRARTPDTGRVIDARGKIVVPGGIEPHAHTGIFVPEQCAVRLVLGLVEHQLHGAAHPALIFGDQQRVGVIPGYALLSLGGLCGTTVYNRNLVG